MSEWVRQAVVLKGCSVYSVKITAGLTLLWLCVTFRLNGILTSGLEVFEREVITPHLHFFRSVINFTSMPLGTKSCSN